MYWHGYLGIGNRVYSACGWKSQGRLQRDMVRRIAPTRESALAHVFFHRRKENSLDRYLARRHGVVARASSTGICAANLHIALAGNSAFLSCRRLPNPYLFDLKPFCPTMATVLDAKDAHARPFSKSIPREKGKCSQLCAWLPCSHDASMSCTMAPPPIRLHRQSAIPPRWL